MKSRPILFSAPMVKAILAGTKTQTRRIVKLPSKPPYGNEPCPYGRPGDQLWVRETFCFVAEGGTLTPAYRADGWTECPSDDGKWKPSIFCTRAASRIALEITDVRMERLQDISEADAVAEGIASDGDEAAVISYASLWDRINGPGSWDANPFVWVITFTKK